LRRLIALLAGLSLVLGVSFPVYAQMPEPDSSFTIDQVEVYRHAGGEANDQLWLISGTIEYATTPTVYSVSDAFIVRIKTAAGVEVGNTTFYSYFDNGYDSGICSIYFDASSVPTWGGSYEVFIEGNPALHWLDTSASSSIGKAIADDGGVMTDETAAANDAVADDVTLMPAAPAADDAYYFGASAMFNILHITVSTNGSWSGTYTYEYWDGDEWKAVSDLSDPTNGFTAGTGTFDITWTCPTDWQTTTVDGNDLYWVRFRIVTFSSITTQPLGQQCWLNTMSSPPSISTDVINWIDEGSVKDAQERLTIRLRSIAQILEDDWGGTTDLVETVAGEKKLTAEGEDYFTNSIVNLRSICPDLFSDVITTPDFGEKTVINDSFMGSDDADHDVYGNNWYAQTFTASGSYDMDGVWLKLFRVGSPGNLTVSLRATAGGLPTGADLVSGTRSASDFTTSTSGEWYWITFTDDYSVTSGTTYAVVMRATAGDANNYVSLRYDSGAGYSGGQVCSSGDGGATWAAVAGDDFLFAVTATEAFSMSYRDRLASRLEGTTFDMTPIGEALGMSRMWASTIVWFGFCTLIAAAVVWGTNSLRPATFVFMILLPFGALAGFVYLEVGLGFGLLCAAAGIFSLFYGRGP